MTTNRDGNVLHRRRCVFLTLNCSFPPVDIQHTAHAIKVSVLILHPREIKQLSHKNDTEILHCTVVRSRQRNATPCHRTGYKHSVLKSIQTPSTQIITLKTEKNENKKNKRKPKIL